MLLTDKEKKIFTDYLQLEINSTIGIIEQMEKTDIPEFVIKKERGKVVAFNFVLNHLLKAETFSVGGE